jgi:WD40 repeat protein
MDSRGNPAISFRQVSFSPNARHIITASADGIARVFDWQRPDARPVLELRGHRSALTSAEFSFDSALIVTSSMDGTVRVWESRPPVADLAARPLPHVCQGESKYPAASAPTGGFHGSVRRFQTAMRASS